MIVVHAFIVGLIVATGGAIVFITTAAIMDPVAPHDSLVVPVIIYVFATALFFIGFAI